MRAGQRNGKADELRRNDGPGSGLKTMQLERHPDCIFCNAAKSLGLELRWIDGAEGEIGVQFRCDDRFQSYPGVVHGGVISLLFDGVMTNRLFAEGKTAVTGELKVRYVESVPIGRDLVLSARIVQSRPPYHRLEADLRCKGRILAKAAAKFMEV